MLSLPSSLSLLSFSLSKPSARKSAWTSEGGEVGFGVELPEGRLAKTPSVEKGAREKNQREDPLVGTSQKHG